DENRRLPSVPPQLLHDENPAAVRQVDVEHDPVIIVDEGEHLCRVAGFGGVHRVAPVLEEHAGQLGDLRVVVDGENAHDLEYRIASRPFACPWMTKMSS